MYSPKEVSARQMRKDWLAKRQARLEQEDPRMPVLEAQGILVPIAGDDRNLWPVSEWNNPLVVSVPASEVTLANGESIAFFLDGTELCSRPIEVPEDLQFSIAPDLLASGKPYELVYEHSDVLGNTMPSIPFVLDVDYQVPNRNQPGAPAVLPDEVASGGLTLEYLETHDTLDITVPRSSDILPGDTITISWVPMVARSFRQDFTPIISKVVTLAEVVTGLDLVVRIDSALIKDLVQGKIGIYYRYIDRTGNLGQFSPATVLQVDLTPAPDGLLAPKVLLAEGDGIDRADAQLGVEVEIPEPIYDNPQADDQIEVIWEGTPVPAVPLDTLPMYIPIDWSTLSANGALDKRSFKVSYNVVRGALSTPSPDLDVTVDFTVAGPEPDPSTPGPINSALPAIVVNSREEHPVDNVLGDADKNVDATAQLVSNPFAAGDTLRLYWGDLRPHVAEFLITEPSSLIAFVIPWEVIERGGYNDKLPVYYSTWNGVNEQESEHIEVDVRILDITGLPDVEFPDRYLPDTGPTPVPVINCCSLPWNGIKIDIPFDPTNMEVGDDVMIKWQAYEDRDGTSPIVSTYHEFDPITLDAGNSYTGIPFVIPYANLVEPIITVGSGRVTYTLKKKVNGQIGEQSTLTIITRVAGTGLCSELFPGVCHAFVGDGSGSTI